MVAPIADFGSDADWAAFVEQHPQSSLFHHPAWNRAVERVFGHRGAHLSVRRGTRLVGVLPLMRVRSFLGGTMLVSTPYATGGGLLCDDAEGSRALAAAAAELTLRCRARVLELRSARAAVSEFATDRRYVGFSRLLPDNPADLATFLPRKARAAARQARERECLDVRHDTRDLPRVWRLYARSMRRLGSINYPYAFWSELVKVLGPDAWLTTVWSADRLVAGVLSFRFRDTVTPYFVGIDERVRCPGASNLLYLAVMERAVAQGIRRFDFGRSRRDNAGAYAFKVNQGFTPVELEYQRLVPAGRPQTDLTPANPRIQFVRRAWTKLPLAVTRPLGAWLARALPG